MRKTLFICLLSLLSLSSARLCAQQLRITHLWSHTDLSFDLNRLYNYNIYENNRWGAGLILSTPLHYDTRYGTLFQNRFEASVYAGWGSGDHAWKYGVETSLAFPRNVFREITVGYHHDIEKVGAHSFQPYNLLNTFENSTYFSSRYSFVDKVFGSVSLDPDGPSKVSLSYSHSAEKLLFNNTGLIYPSIYPEEALRPRDFDEMDIQLRWGDYWIVDLLAGVSHLRHTQDESHGHLRAFMQYGRTFKIGKKAHRLSFLGQAGSTSGDATPIARRFDISGTGGSIYFFRNTFLTVRPNSFLADTYAEACTHFITGKPLWDNAISSPKPFLQLNAVWGTLHQNGKLRGSVVLDMQQGSQASAATDHDMMLALIAPDKGLMEAAAGFEGLIHWGVLDIGAAAAYQFTPKKSLYYQDNFFNKFAVMFIATLVLDTES